MHYYYYYYCYDAHNPHRKTSVRNPASWGQL
jgi:hypothetical protein